VDGYSIPARPLDQLLQLLAGATNVLILPHNDPDPDAIASAMGLRHLLAQRLGLDAQVAYQGIIGRAENKALVRYLGRPLRQLAEADLRRASHLVLVDTQPGAGNNPLPAGRVPSAVVDHHTWRAESAQAPFVDVRPEQGATSTIVTEYLQAAELDLPKGLATALFYGIKTDTMGLGRGAGLGDVAAYYYLQPLVDIEALVEIERAQVPASYFRSYVTAIQAARVYGPVVLAYIGGMSYPDQAAEIADLLSRLEGVQWVMCMGAYNDTLILAVRSRSRRTGAGQLVRAVVGNLGMAGGHGTMAGGQVPLRGADPAPMAERLGQAMLNQLKVPPATPGLALTT
jgi:nanoRNase/pAp phosphatase (c-di-AMP/oligoRNAs hydrolase)